MKRFKSLLAIAFSIAMVIGMGNVSFAAEDDKEAIVLDEGLDGGFVGHTITSDKDNYKYGGYVNLKGATKDYRYLQLTYTGSLRNIRFEIQGIVFWFNNLQAITAEGAFVDVKGNYIDTSYSDKERTIVIDLEKSGIELGSDEMLHIHTDMLATDGGVTFTDGRLLKVYTEPVKQPVKPKAIMVEAAGFTDENGVLVKTLGNGEIIVYSIQKGDFMEYTINVAADGCYQFNVNAGRQYAGTSKISLRENGKVLARANIGCTGGWHEYKNFKGTDIYLTAGEHKVRLYADGGGYNIASFKLIPYGTSLDTSKKTVYIEAEDYSDAEKSCIGEAYIVDLVMKDGETVEYREEKTVVRIGYYVTYTVEIPVDGYYYLSAYATALSRTELKLVENDEIIGVVFVDDICSSLQIYRNYKDYFGGINVYLTAGTHTFTIWCENPGTCAVDYFKFVESVY